MSDIVIKAEKLGKKYVIGHQSEGGRYLALRDVLVQNARGLWQKTRDLIQGKPIIRGETLEDFWALSDVSFDIQRGEAVGIIGRNGAGKSTLLKVLSRITEPSAGRLTIKGRVASLLEVGTGFHPELTGRENIYLNGAILGMTRQEIKSKYDEIVAFAEVERFLDTPVKRYSSGMYVRLAFAIAAHLEPEILVVDEVLAVGDAQFQKKCLGKMGDVARGGRTVLFVSHNMGAISSLCDSGILLDSGKLVYSGNVITTISKYLETGNSESTICRDDNPNLIIQILTIKVLNEDNEIVSSHPYWKPLKVFLKLAVKENIAKVYLALHIHDSSLETILFSRDFDLNERSLLNREPGIYEYAIKIPGNLLVPGAYKISLHVAWSSPPEIIDGVDFVCPFDIIDDQSVMAKVGFPWRGKIATFLEWDYEISAGLSPSFRQGENM